MSGGGIGLSNPRFEKWQNVLSNVGDLQEEAAAEKDTVCLIGTARLMATHCDMMRVVDPKLTELAVYQNANLAWMLLLQSNFVESEQTARRALELDNTQTFVKVALAHALLFQNKYEAAKTLYLELKPKKNVENGRDYREILLEDLDTLEQKGLTHKRINDVRQLLRQ